VPARPAQGEPGGRGFTCACASGQWR
jgi:hypothetical protein